MAIRVKRAYEATGAEDGYRVLVDRLWPRGVTKQKLNVEAWLKEIAPSTALRQWIHSDMSRWLEFKRRYFKELDLQPDLVADLRKRARAGTLTLVFAARDADRNHAVLLKEYLEGP